MDPALFIQAEAFHQSVKTLPVKPVIYPGIIGHHIKGRSVAEEIHLIRDIKEFLLCLCIFIDLLTVEGDLPLIRL